MNKSSLVVSYLLLVIIIIIAAFFRLYNIAELPPGLYPDEAMNGNNALEALETGNFKIFYPENNGREGLFINIQAISVAIFGNLPWALRIVSALFGILTVWGVYFLTKELFAGRSSISLLSAFLMAVSFWHINFSRIGFRAIMAPFFLTWGIYFLLKAFRQIKERKSPKFHILNSIFSGIFYGLGFHSYIAYRATPLLILIIIAIYWLKNRDPEAEPRRRTSSLQGRQVPYGAGWQIRKKILLAASGCALLAVIVAAPLGLYFLKNPQDFFGRTTQISVFNSPAPIKDLTTNILKTAGMFNFSGDYNWRHNIAGAPLLFWPTGILFLIGLFLSIRQLKIKNWRLIIPLIWMAVAALPTVISNEGLPHALRAILMAPPVFILAGVGGIWIIENLKSQISNLKNSNQKLKIFYSLLAIFYLLLIIEAYQSYFIKWGKNPNVQGAFSADYVEMGRALNALPKDLPKYIVVEAGGVDVRGIPMPAQTTMFITDTFTPEKQKEKNIFYILPNEKDKILLNSYTVSLY
jgi:4-amino-4-deoxy-L-arabinose transferase-like glycosyltransferase